MIRQDVYVKDWNWTVHAFFAVNEYWVEPIMDLLWEVGCDSESAKRAFDNLTSGKLNNGLCYSNYRRQESVMVIAKTSCAAEFFNSLVHELTHLQSHVCDVYHLDPKCEDIAYFTGDLSMQMFPKINHLLCDCCRTEYNEDYE